VARPWRSGWTFLAALGLVAAVVITGAVALRPGPVGTPFYLILFIVAAYAVAHAMIRMDGYERLRRLFR